MSHDRFAPGSLIGEYRIEELAGRGGMGLVFRATQSRPMRTVALKVITPELADDPDFRSRFERESLIAAEIEHPNVIPVYDVGEDDGILFIVMRFVNGVDLRRLRQHAGSITAQRAARMIAQIAAALDAAHAHGLVHRDVKPGNVLVAGRDPDEHLYLTDFGLTRRIMDSRAMTASGEFVGTIDYMAPEQARGERVDARTDIYALGCVLYELLAGSVPFPREGDIAKIFAHLNDPAPLLRDALPGVPAALDAAVARALAKSPDDRFFSASDFARAVTAGVSGSLDPTPERSVATGDAAPPPAHARTHVGSTERAQVSRPRTTRRRDGRQQPPREWSGAGTGEYASVTPRTVRNPRGDQRDRNGSHAGRPWLPAVLLALVAGAASAVVAVVLLGHGGTPLAKTVKTTPTTAIVPAAALVATTVKTTTETRTLTIAGGGARVVTRRPTRTATRSRALITRRASTVTRREVIVVTTSTSTLQTAAQVDTTQAASSLPAPQSSASAPLELAAPVGAGFHILVPSDWTLSGSTESGTYLWAGQNPLDKLQVTVSDCAACVTGASGGPDPGAVGRPAGTVSSVNVNKWVIIYQAYTSGDPYPDNGILEVRHSGPTPTGYVQVDLWLSSQAHSTATRILNSFATG